MSGEFGDNVIPEAGVAASDDGDFPREVWDVSRRVESKSGIRLSHVFDRERWLLEEAVERQNVPHRCGIGNPTPWLCHVGERFFSSALPTSTE